MELLDMDLTIDADLFNHDQLMADLAAWSDQFNKDWKAMLDDIEKDGYLDLKNLTLAPL